MGYIPKFVHLDEFVHVVYPFGINWKHELIEKSTKALYDIYKEEIVNGTVMAFITRGTSGAMIAGAMMNELHHICPFANSCIIVVRKESDKSAHCSSLKGIEDLDNARLIVVDDFISSGNTVLAILEELDRYFEVIPSAKEKYDMLCVSNPINARKMKKKYQCDWDMWKAICSRFNIVVCCPEPE